MTTEIDEALKVPTISVVIPTYNRANLVGRAIQSVLNQTYQDFEIIVIDDASTDDTDKIMILVNDKRIKYIKNKKNIGGSESRNIGIKNAKGKYIAFLDSDDEWMPTKLEKQLRKINESSVLAKIIYTGYWVVKNSILELGQIPSKKGNIHRELLYQDYVNPTSTVFLKKNCFEKIGYFNHILNARQDYDMWLRLSRHYNFDYVKEPLVKLFVTENCITRNIKSRFEAFYIIISKIIEEMEHFSDKEKKSILSTQYFSMARYCQKQNEINFASFFLKEAMKNKLINLKNWILFFSIKTNFNIDNKYIINIKNFLKTIINKLF